MAFSGAVDAQDQSLSSQASDPTASLMSFQLQSFYAPDLHKSDQDQNIVQFRAALPYQIGGVNNIARVTLPYVTDTASGAKGFQEVHEVLSLGDCHCPDCFISDQFGRHVPGLSHSIAHVLVES